LLYSNYSIHYDENFVLYFLNTNYYFNLKKTIGLEVKIIIVIYLELLRLRNVFNFIKYVFIVLLTTDQGSGVAV